MMEKRTVTASSDNRTIAKYAAAAFGGRPDVVEYGHEELDLTVGILECKDRPTQGVTAYSTIKLSDYPMLDGEKEFPMRLELCTAFASSYSIAANILATAAFIVMRTNRVCFPGAVIENAVREYDPDSLLPHLYLTSPFLWENDLKSLKLPAGNTVTWLLAIPVAQTEVDYLCNHNAQSLESIFESRQIDFFNPHREAVL
ncbi:MAG TPA: suppressor of fused domain protein [Planctomycetaceae bacterium]|nr:suppressor of fused domain protein [Planctomycetaceae bacterium]